MNNILLMHSRTMAFNGIYMLINPFLMDNARKSPFICFGQLGALNVFPYKESYFPNKCVFVFPLPSLIHLFMCLCVFVLCLFFPLSKLETQQGELSPKDPRCPHSFDITWKLFQTTSFVIFESFSFVSIYHFETNFNIKLNFKILIFVISISSENISKYHSSLTMILLSKSFGQSIKEGRGLQIFMVFY